MLPGFRVALATVVLTVSVLVFGLGAAALLRASHDQFASLPPAQAPREAAVREHDAREITLAALRVEMMAEQRAAPAPSPPAVAEAQPADAAVASTEPAAAIRDDAVPIPAGVPADGPAVAVAAQTAVVETAVAAPIPDVAANDRPRAVAAADPAGADPVAAPLAVVATERALAEGDGPERSPDSAKGPVCAPSPAAASWLQLSMLGDPAQAGTSLLLLKRSGSAAASLYWPPAAVVRHRHRLLRLHHARLRRHRPALRARLQTQATAVQAAPGDPFASFGQTPQARPR